MRQQQQAVNSSSSNSGGGVRWFESDSSHNNKLVQALYQIDWQQFHQFLLQRMAAKTAEDRLRYAKQYASVVLTTAGKGAKILSPLDLLQLSPNKRIHVMKAISCLARFTGQQDVWLAIRKRYGLQWSTGTEKIDAFTRFFDSSRDLDTLVSWLKEALAVLPSNYANFLRFCTCTGLRGSEAVEAVRLIKGLESFKTYYNPASQILQHYLYPAIFIRRTKACYVSVVNDQVVELALKIGQNLV